MGLLYSHFIQQQCSIDQLVPILDHLYLYLNNGWEIDGVLCIVQVTALIDTDEMVDTSQQPQCESDGPHSVWTRPFATD